jgi:hypothetical protein
MPELQQPTEQLAFHLIDPLAVFRRSLDKCVHRLQWFMRRGQCSFLCHHHDWASRAG